MGLIYSLFLGGITAALTYFFGYSLWVLIVLGVLWLAALVISFGTGHHGFGGHGNTDLMIVFAALFITGAIVLPKYIAQTPCYQAREALKNVAEAQNEYKSRNGTFARYTGLLNFKEDPGVSVLVIMGNAEFFVATSSHAACKEKDGSPRVFTWDSLRGGLQ